MRVWEIWHRNPEPGEVQHGGSHEYIHGPDTDGEDVTQLTKVIAVRELRDALRVESDAVLRIVARLDEILDNANQRGAADG